MSHAIAFSTSGRILCVCFFFFWQHLHAHLSFYAEIKHEILCQIQKISKRYFSKPTVTKQCSRWGVLSQIHTSTWTEIRAIWLFTVRSIPWTCAHEVVLVKHFRGLRLQFPEFDAEFGCSRLKSQQIDVVTQTKIATNWRCYVVLCNTGPDVDRVTSHGVLTHESDSLLLHVHDLLLFATGTVSEVFDCTSCIVVRKHDTIHLGTFIKL